MWLIIRAEDVNGNINQQSIFIDAPTAAAARHAFWTNLLDYLPKAPQMISIRIEDVRCG